MDNFDYDAFVIYNPHGQDQEFVNLMTRVLTSAPYNLRLYVPWTDNAEPFEAVAIAENIEKRCKKVLVVISEESLQSDLFHFQLRIAHAMSPSARSRKIIPIRLDATDVPDMIRFSTPCDYYKQDLRVFIWDRIFASFRNYSRPLKCSKSIKTSPTNRQVPDVVPRPSPLRRVKSWWRMRATVA
ncbi:myeloid differentiation primary response protein MyD88-like [Crassostrea virginica]|uniref:Myeloid differentiation primary response protein MyD88-like n=1 Tax=Crassostrea virginica TaxID=6565 RepID=A0A8B8EYC0_CRAVI|nr:myeloid differentiation primary response protein MyD88-like [Crassostrea virginica]